MATATWQWVLLLLLLQLLLPPRCNGTVVKYAVADSCVQFVQSYNLLVGVQVLNTRVSLQQPPPDKGGIVTLNATGYLNGTGWYSNSTLAYDALSNLPVEAQQIRITDTNGSLAALGWAAADGVASTQLQQQAGRVFNGVFVDSGIVSNRYNLELSCEGQRACLFCVYGQWEVYTMVAEVLLLAAFITYTVVNTVTGRGMELLGEVRFAYLIFSMLCLHVASFVSRLRNCALSFYSTGTSWLLAALIGFSTKIDAPAGDVVELYYMQVLTAFGLIFLNNATDLDLKERSRDTWLLAWFICGTAFTIVAWLVLTAFVRTEKRVSLSYILSWGFLRDCGWCLTDDMGRLRATALQQHCHQFAALDDVTRSGVDNASSRRGGAPPSSSAPPLPPPLSPTDGTTHPRSPAPATHCPTSPPGRPDSVNYIPAQHQPSGGTAVPPDSDFSWAELAGLGAYLQVVCQVNRLYSRWMFWFPTIRGLQLCHIAFVITRLDQDLKEFGSGVKCVQYVIKWRYVLPLVADIVLLLSASWQIACAVALVYARQPAGTHKRQYLRFATLWRQWLKVVQVWRHELETVHVRQEGFSRYKTYALQAVAALLAAMTFPVSVLAWAAAGVLDLLVEALVCDLAPWVQRQVSAGQKGGAQQGRMQPEQVLVDPAVVEALQSNWRAVLRRGTRPSSTAAGPSIAAAGRERPAPIMETPHGPVPLTGLARLTVDVEQ